MSYHIVLMIIFSALASLVFTFIAKTGAKDRTKYFLFLFGCFVVLSIITGWLMRPFPF